MDKWHTGQDGIGFLYTIYSIAAILSVLVGGMLADRVSRMVKRLRVEDEVVLTGGGGKNIGLVQALSKHLGHDIRVPPEPLITGALGAALLGRDMVRKAEEQGKPLEKKERVLEEIEIL